MSSVDAVRLETKERLVRRLLRAADIQFHRLRGLFLLGVCGSCNQHQMDLKGQIDLRLGQIVARISCRSPVFLSDADQSQNNAEIFIFLADSFLSRCDCVYTNNTWLASYKRFPVEKWKKKEGVKWEYDKKVWIISRARGQSRSISGGWERTFPVGGRKRGSGSPQGGRGSRVGGETRFMWNGMPSVVKAPTPLRKRADVAARRDPCSLVSASGGWGGVRHSTRSVGECDLVSLRRGRRPRLQVLPRASGRFFGEQPGIVISDVSVSCEYYLGDPSVHLAGGIVEKGGCDAGDR